MKILKMCGSKFYNGFYEFGLYRGKRKLASFGIVFAADLMPNFPGRKKLGLIWWAKG